MIIKEIARKGQRKTLPQPLPCREGRIMIRVLKEQGEKDQKDRPRKGSGAGLMTRTRLP